jgi:hypothetical protein
MDGIVGFSLYMHDVVVKFDLQERIRPTSKGISDKQLQFQI